MLLDYIAALEQETTLELVKVEAIQMQMPLYPSARRRSENDVIRNFSSKHHPFSFQLLLYGVTIDLL